jgi:hypothetical protein
VAKKRDDEDVQKAGLEKASALNSLKNAKEKEAVEVRHGNKVSRGRGGSSLPVEKVWEEFLARVKEINIHVAALLKSTSVVNFDGEHLTLEVFYRFHKDKLEEPKVIAKLDEVMSKLLKANIKFKFTLAQRGSSLPKAVAKSNVVDIRGEDLAQIAQEIFSK